MPGLTETSLEAVREYWDKRPCNIRHSAAPLGSGQYFDEVEQRKYFVEPHIPGFAEFERWQDCKVREIGCGIGTDTINFARAGAQVTAVDLSPQSVELARQRAEVYGLTDRIQFHVGDAENLSNIVRPEPYDLVYSFGVIHHTPDPEAVTAQIRDHFVGPGTTFKLMVYNRFSWKALSILVAYGKTGWWNWDTVVARYSEAQGDCPITHTYSSRGIKNLLGSGFSIEDMRKEHIFPYHIPAYINYRYVKNWQFRFLPKPVFRSLEKHMGWHWCVTAVAQ